MGNSRQHFVFKKVNELIETLLIRAHWDVDGDKCYRQFTIRRNPGWTLPCYRIG